jgi:excinuclease ABC subunit C
VERSDYLELVHQAIRILKGGTEEVAAELEELMVKASSDLRFEDAALYRDRLEVLRKVGEDSNQVQFTTGATDCFGLYREGNNVELSVLTVRQGRLFESKTYGFENVEGPSEEMLSSALVQFYSSKQQIPEQILIPIEIEGVEAHADLYSEKRGGKVELKVPLRGSKARLLLLANQNAKQNFEGRFSDIKKSDRLLVALQDHLKLDSMPRTIECVDISHFQGGSTVGAMVCFKDAKPERSRYRTFHLSLEGKVDDFASIKEVVGRHLSRCVEENSLSDLMVIDGGKAQLSQAVLARNELGLEQPIMVGMAKKRVRSLPYFARAQSFDAAKLTKPERIFLESGEAAIVLNPRNEVLHLLERIRNETHRVAIGFHRKVRTGSTLKSALDDIPGVGEKRRNDLLREFKSIEKLSGASAEEISKRAGVPISLAKNIKRLLK